ncbi:RDD family protein [Gilvimarinus sp. DA14]|uniref:RDD family protein n=1 Tax=Gilvimarinus sp. DA14 TaxID=2956798 RepID=UPI0020B8F5E8|nr:RDD family protein [Gilvimarinus sp. DA14]UTF60886.1 RDD family protein [Gilvimarinus sp. DA14]
MNETQPLPSVANAGLAKRLAAAVYDWLLLLAISIGYGAAVLAVKVKLLGLELAEGEKASMGLLGFAGWLLVLMAFYCLFWRRFGQTLGMKAWRLKVTDINGENITLARGMLRCCCAILSALPAGLGYWWMLVDSQRLTLHDRLSGTRVWQLPKGL